MFDAEIAAKSASTMFTVPAGLLSLADVFGPIATVPAPVESRTPSINGKVFPEASKNEAFD